MPSIQLKIETNNMFMKIEKKIVYLIRIELQTTSLLSMNFNIPFIFHWKSCKYHVECNMIVKAMLMFFDYNHFQMNKEVPIAGVKLSMYNMFYFMIIKLILFIQFLGSFCVQLAEIK